MMDRKGKPVTVGARVVFGKGRTVGWVRTIQPCKAGLGLRGSFMARCDDGPTAEDDLTFTASEWVDSNHVEVIS